MRRSSRARGRADVCVGGAVAQRRTFVFSGVSPGFLSGCSEAGDGDAVVQAFADIGWGWGGDWNSLKDYQHFSENGT